MSLITIYVINAKNLFFKKKLIYNLFDKIILIILQKLCLLYNIKTYFLVCTIITIKNEASK